MENIEKIEKNFIKQDFSRREFNNRKYNKKFAEKDNLKKKYNYQSKFEKNNINNKKLADYQFSKKSN